MYYEAIGEIISAEQNQETQIEYIRSAVRPMYDGWKNMLQSSQNNEQFMRQDDVLRDLSFFMVTNQKLCSSIGYNYRIFFGKIF